ncbi:SMI1/KNR4 family protein [Actinosynnema sp. NPDC023587]|uniref:SMI1/KNR4 family protein n=1 Tax=Actinosynnema sp. NPDC023587 TaxID=3154695 RepID=UPI0033C42165
MAAVVGIEALTSLVPPPAVPVGAEGDWHRVEADLGLRLPADYRELVTRYGSGGFGDIGLLTPFDPCAGGAGSLVGRAHALLDLHGPFRDEWPEDVPFPLHPEPGGVLEWALTGNGDALCWLTEGDPDDWPTVVWNVRGGAERFDLGAVALLHGYLVGRCEARLLPAPPSVPWFDPYRELSHVCFTLSDGELPYVERLRILRAALHPTADRGGFDNGDGVRQDHFKAVAREWRLTYENCYGHQVRVAFPPAEADEVRAVVLDAARTMGCEVLATTTR